MSRAALVALSLSAFCLVACATPAQPPKKPATTTTAKAAPKAPAKAESLTGTAVAPAGMVAAGAGNMVAAGAGNMVAAGAGNMVAAGAGNYRTGDGRLALMAIDEQPLANAPVWLVEANEQGEVPSREPDAVTDAQGRFTLPIEQKSATGAYAVVVGGQNADGKSAPLHTIVEASPGGKTARIDAASTLVAATLRKRGAGAFASFDAGAFAQLVALMASRISAEDLPDFSDLEAVASKADALAERFAELKDGLQKWGDAVKSDPTSILNGSLPAIPGLPGLPR